MDSGFGFFRGIFSGGKSIVMQTSIVFEPKSREEGRGVKVSEGVAPVEESQASDNIL